MRSRVLGATLLALGVVALIFAGGLAFVVAPTVKQLPYNMKATQSVAEAPNATFLQITNGVAKVNTGTLRSTVNVTPDAKATADLEKPLDGKAMVWLVGQEVVNTGSTELVSAYSTALAVDRKSGAAQQWDGQWLDTGNRESVNYSGQIYKFPFGTEKKTYPIFDRDLLGTRPANFVKTEQIEGLETYQFTQEIRNEKLVVPADRLSVVLSQLAPGAKSGVVTYDNTRTVWVEPTTGQFIKVQELQKKTLTPDVGQPVVLLDAPFVYTDDTIRSAAETAKENRQKLALVTMWAPIGLSVLGAILLIVGIMLVARGRRQMAAAAAVPAQRRGGARHSAAAQEESDRSSSDTSDSAKAGKSGSTAD